MENNLNLYLLQKAFQRVNIVEMELRESYIIDINDFRDICIDFSENSPKKKKKKAVEKAKEILKKYNHKENEIKELMEEIVKIQKKLVEIKSHLFIAETIENIASKELEE